MLALKAGNIELLYDHGFLRTLRSDQNEILRMIYFAIRDENWQTLTQHIADEQINIGDNSFSISYTATVVQKNKSIFTWRVIIEGSRMGEISYEIKGKPLEQITTNRAGFCVLHPIQGLAGHSVHIKHAHQSDQEYYFPVMVDPYQPFVDIIGMQWQSYDQSFSLAFEGDIFETEDQRNWGDASFKTYCTPLHIPFPRTLSIDEEVHQKIIFKSLAVSKPSIKQVPLIHTNPARFDLGVNESTDILNLSAACVQKLKEINFSFYGIEVHAYEAVWIQKLGSQIEQGLNLEIPFKIDLIVSDLYIQEIEIFLSKIKLLPISIKYITLFLQSSLVTRQDIINVIPYLKTNLPNTKIGVGTNYNFTELNRNRFDPLYADYISFSYNPQEHATDDLTIMENIETLSSLVQSAQHLYHKPIHISPITLKRRYNPYATDPAALTVTLDQQYDPRIKQPFMAQWADQLLHSLLYTNVAAITLLATVGSLGLMDEKGNEYPLYPEVKQFCNHNVTTPFT